MGMRKTIIAMIIGLNFGLLYSQNMRPDCNAFYDIRDTSVAIKGFYETVHLLDVASQELNDSLLCFVEKSIPQLTDTLGYTFILSLQCEKQDSGHLHVYIAAHINLSLGRYYEMMEYRSTYTCYKNKRSTLGCIKVGEYYILVVVPNYFAESELRMLFKEKRELQRICIHMVREELELSWDYPQIGQLPQKHFTLELHDRMNYVSPVCEW